MSTALLAGQREMNGYRYQPGDRPLEGYTIRRAAGRGGFGEVYFAVSDGGREVALKTVHAGEQVELRGIAQCMNLKSPHLVSIFDVRRGERGEPIVLMEYVSGPSLRQLLDESPQGLGEQKAVYLVCEIARGLSALHECGIVHRDLKPANIFYEDGTVKIGDYGLAKAIGASAMSGQTLTVGTVHYMAPEIGSGNYSRSVDVYALGVIFYEMLTGKVPFEGESPGEVLIKHSVAPVDLAGIQPPLAGVITRALAKDPAERYATAAEMAESLRCAVGYAGDAAVGAAMDLSTAAARVTVPAASAAPSPAKPASAPAAAAAPPATAVIPSSRNKPRHDDRRPLALAVVVMAAIAVGCGVLELGAQTTWAGLLGSALIPLTMMAGVVAGVSTAHSVRHAGTPAGDGPTGWDRVTYAAMASLGTWAAWIVLQLGEMAGFAAPPVSLAAMVWLGVVLLNWPRYLAPQRPMRVGLMPLLYAVVLAMALTWLLGDGEATLLRTIAILAGATIAVQAAAPRVTRDGTAQPGVDTTAIPRGGRVQRPWHNSEAWSKPAWGPVHNASDAVPAHPATGLADPPRTTASNRYRFWALLLAAGWFVGVSGLHRFYAGKIWTGLLYLCTGGIFGVGQIIDVVLIAMGAFEDHRERPLLAWIRADELEPSLRAGAGDDVGTAPGGPHALVARSIASAGNTALGWLGGAMLIASAAIATFFALDVPGLLASGLVDGQLARELEELLVYPHWDALARKLLAVTATMIAIAGGVALVIARQRQQTSGLHIGRAVLGPVLLIAAAFLFEAAMPSWAGVVAHMGVSEGQLLAGLDLWSRNARTGPLSVAVLAMVTGVLMLAWPATPRTMKTD